jgi:hypothetical protein
VKGEPLTLAEKKMVMQAMTKTERYVKRCKAMKGLPVTVRVSKKSVEWELLHCVSKHMSGEVSTATSALNELTLRTESC